MVLYNNKILLIIQVTLSKPIQFDINCWDISVFDSTWEQISFTKLWERVYSLLLRIRSNEMKAVTRSMSRPTANVSHQIVFYSRQKQQQQQQQ